MTTSCIARSAAALGCALFAAASPALAAKDRLKDLIYEVRSEAAWRGVEVERIRLDGDSLRVLGHDRTEAAVTLQMSCSQFGYVCTEKQDGFSAMTFADAAKQQTRTASRD